MANICDTTYKITTGEYLSVMALWEKLQELKVNEKDVPLYLLAESFGIDYEAEGIGVRGSIYYADLEENDEFPVVTIETETAWVGCHDLFHAINSRLEDGLSISYCEVECGCEIFAIHDECDFFPYECYVTACGDLFEDCEDYYSTIDAAIDMWCERMGVKRHIDNTEAMMKYINDFQYDMEDTGITIHEFEYE